MQKILATVTAAVALAFAPAAAWADSCLNVSRAPAPCGTSCPSPVVAANWVWLPSIGVPFPAWGFSPPGSITSIELGLPNAHGQYLGQQGVETWLLENSAICGGKVVTRQTDHGIQSGCGA